MSRKKLEDLEFDELVAEAAWEIVEALLNGKPLKVAVRGAMSKTLQWRVAKDKEEQ